MHFETLKELALKDKIMSSKCLFKGLLIYLFCLVMASIWKETYLILHFVNNFGHFFCPTYLHGAGPPQYLVILFRFLASYSVIQGCPWMEIFVNLVPYLYVAIHGEVRE